MLLVNVAPPRIVQDLFVTTGYLNPVWPEFVGVTELPYTLFAGLFFNVSGPVDLERFRGQVWPKIDHKRIRKVQARLPQMLFARSGPNQASLLPRSAMPYTLWELFTWNGGRQVYGCQLISGGFLMEG